MALAAAGGPKPPYPNPKPHPNPKSGFCKTTKTYCSLRPSHAPLDPRLPLSLPDYLFSSLNSSPLPPGPAFIDSASGYRISFHEVARAVRLLADYLASIGIRKGQAVLVVSHNSIYVPVVALAVLSLGAIFTASNPAGTASDVSYHCELSKPALAIVESSNAHLLPQPLSHRPIIIDSSDFLAIIKPDSNVSEPVGWRPTTQSVISQDDPATILYSSGTTGKVKGVTLTHRNYISTMAANLGLYAARPAAAIGLLTVPMFHIYGFGMMLGRLSLGDTMVVLPRFGMGSMLQAVERYRVNYIAAAPPVVVAFSKFEGADQYDLSSLALIGSGGAPLGKEVIERILLRFPQLQISVGYGLTESTGGITNLVGPEETKRHGSVGKMAANMEAKIVNPETGMALPPGQQGELWLRGEPIMPGYVDNAEATSSILHPDGWLKTGDLGFFDEDGFLFVVDRLKELIKYKGYQVAPADLEHLLLSHPEILDAAVIPYPDEDAGQIPMAFVVRHPNTSLTEEQVMEFIAKQVAPYKRVRRVAFVNSIPKNAAGKILRRELVNHSLRSFSSRL